jgi:hypothetical protein
MVERTGRLTGSIAFGVLLMFVASASGDAKVTPQRVWQSAYMGGPSQARRLTIKRDGATLMTLEVPVGVYLSVQADRSTGDDSKGGRVGYHGDVRIRTRIDELGPTYRGVVDIDDYLSAAPLVLTVRRADVFIDRVIMK